jgi:hypothetical protein
MVPFGVALAQTPDRPTPPRVLPGGLPFRKAATLKRIHVLFPHSRDAQQITVEQTEDGDLVYQGDILIDTASIIHDPSARGNRPADERLRFLRSGGQPRFRTYSAAAALWFGMGKWDKGIVPYTFSSNMPQGHRDVLARAALHISSRTHLCLRPRQPGEDDYIEFVAVRNKVYAGQSALGKQGGRQEIRIDVADFEGRPDPMFSVALHEILHALGVIHEQSRSDRDDHVRILIDNIINPDSTLHNFDKDIYSQNFFAYDMTSIMHYHPRAFGEPGPDGREKVTIEPVDTRKRIEPMSDLSPIDILGLNRLYDETEDCQDRPFRIRVHMLTPDGTPGIRVYDSVMSAGWSDAAPLQFSAPQPDFMMFLNRNTSQAVVKRIHFDGRFRETVYSKRWTPGWTHLETVTIGGIPYILHYKKPYLSPMEGLPYGVPVSDTSGQAVIAKVDGVPSFAGNTLGSQPYRADWGTGWQVIRFFTVGGNPYLFRLNERTNRAQIFRIDPQLPFAGNRLGTLVYDKHWTDGWTEVRFFQMSGKTYVFHLKSGSGLTRISEVDDRAPFADNNLGILRYEGNTDEGWTNVDITTTLQNRTFLFLGNRETGRVNICAFNPGDTFGQGTPYTVVHNARWSKGWTFAAFFRVNSDHRLLIMKQ